MTFWLVMFFPQEQDVSRERQEKEQRFEEMARLVEALKKEKDEERERHSLELQRLRTEMRDMADRHRHEVVQSEVNHKVCVCVFVCMSVCTRKHATVYNTCTCTCSTGICNWFFVSFCVRV